MLNFKISVRILFLFVSAFVAQGVYAQTPTPTPPPEDDDQVITVDSRLVQIEAVVKDKKGNIIRDLTAADFELVVNGKVRPVDFFSYVQLAGGQEQRKEITEVWDAPRGIKQSEVKRTMVFIVSNPDLKLTSMANTINFSGARTVSYRQFTMLGLELSKRFLEKFINETMSESDLVSIVDTESNLGTLSNFTNDKGLLLAATKHIEKSVQEGRYPTHNAEFIVRGRGDYQWMANHIIQQNLNTLQIAESAVEQLKKVPGQKFVFLLSRGMLGAVDITGAEAVLQRTKRVIEKANQAKVTFYSLGLRTLGEESSPSGVIQSSDLMRKLAIETGGRGVFNTNDISVGFKAIMAENNGYYQLAFSPDDGDDPKGYDVKVRLKRQGLTAQHRSSVYPDSSIAENSDTKDSVLKLLRTPFRSDTVKIKLATDYKATNKKQGNITTVVNIAPELLTPTMLDSGTREVKLQLGIQVTEPDNLLARQEVKTFSLRISQESWQQVQKEGLVYQFETATKKQGAYSVKIAACVNETNQCGNIESMVNVK